MKILVCGSRTWTDAGIIWRELAKYRDQNPTIIEGEASGADSLARDLAYKMGLKVIACHPDWARYGQGAGIIRNYEMLEMQPDLVLAFQRAGSRGTQHTIDIARKRGIKVEIFTCD